MSMLFLLLDLFLKPSAPKPFKIGRILGHFILMIAAGLGLFFLFQALVPIVGYLESGGIICGALVIIALFFLYFSQEKIKPKLKPQPDLVEVAQEAIKSVEVEIGKIFKQDTPKVILLSLVAGVTLYQISALLRGNTKKN